MKSRKLLSLVFLIAILTSCENPATSTKKDSAVSADTVKVLSRYIRILDADALNLIDSTAVIEVIAEGYKWTEGPLFISDGDYLLYSDVPANKIYKWKEGKG